ncbi:telomeric DNA binding protein [Daedaleopsis nitida]|nr:telomeric DNA binding protein [Daedaleopsis nitida]
MSSEYTDATFAQIRDTIARLQSSIQDLETLLPLLAAPLACLGLLPPRFGQYNISPLSSGQVDCARHIPLLQRALLEHIIPTWESILRQEHKYDLIEQYFCPDVISFASPAAGQVALYAYSTILSLQLRDASVSLLARLCKAYPIEVLHSVLYPSTGRTVASPRHSVSWEDCVRNLIAIPTKVANYTEGKSTSHVLEYGTYFADMCMRTEILIYTSSSRITQERISSLTYLLGKLVNVGVFPPSIPASPAQPSFFRSTLSVMRTRLGSSDGSRYSALWNRLCLDLPSSQNLRTVMTSLFSSLTTPQDGLSPEAHTRGVVKREATLLRRLIGTLGKDNGELLDCFSAVALGRSWEEGHARIFACWGAVAQGSDKNREGLELFLAKVLDIWTDAEHVRHSLLSQHRYLTSLLLLTINQFPAPSPAHELALSPPFVRSISTYISHLDPSVRRCGMLVAEEVARAAGKALNFGEWEGEDQGRPWCRKLRDLLQACDADADELEEDELQHPRSPMSQPAPTIPEDGPSTQIALEVPTSGYDSDDSMTGYASPASSRSASPTPSDLEEIERDPTVRVGVKKVPRPVYLAQLGEMVRSSGGLQGGNEQDTATKNEVALDVAEELIRRKSGYGSELEENAVNLVYGFVGLQDNYDLDGFDQKRQAALNALVACCPRKAAPTIIEQFFTNQYSTDQRFVMLNALALGSRELTSLPVPDLPGGHALPTNKTAFPSKQLPPALHKKYVTTGDQLSTNNPVQHLLEGISQLAIEKGKSATEDKVPELVRERNLRVRPSSKISEVTPTSSSARNALMHQLASVNSRHAKLTSFSDVAAEFFICPLIHRFWQFLRDEQAREARSAHQPLLHRYRSAGSGLVLGALVLGRMLETLAVLVHAARNAREWLHVIAPDALELALTLGTRPVSRGEGVDEDEDEDADTGPGAGGEKSSKEAAVLTAALELSLVVLDGCLDLDEGRSLGLGHTALLMSTGEWAGKVFGSLEDGAKVLGGGGVQEVRLRRAAAGVILKVDELTAKWRRSMIELV